MYSNKQTYTNGKIALYCEEDNAPIRSICYFLDCDRRLLCRKCLKTHKQSHLNSMVFIEDIIDQSIIKEIDEVIDILDGKKGRSANLAKNLLNIIGEYRVKVIEKVKNLAFPANYRMKDLQLLRSEIHIKFQKILSGQPLSADFINDFADIYNTIDRTFINSQRENKFELGISTTLNYSLVKPKFDEMKILAEQAFLQLQDAFLQSVKLYKNEIDINRFSKICTFSNPYDDIIWDMAYVKNIDYFITAGSNGRLAIYNQHQEPVLVCVAHQDGINVVKTLDEKGLIITGSNDGNIKIWKLDVVNSEKAALKLVGIFENHHSNVYAIEFDPLSKLIYSGGNDKTLRIWGGNDLDFKEIQVIHFFDVISSILYKKEDNFAVVGLKDGSISVHHIQLDGRVSAEIYLLSGHTSWVFALQEYHNSTIFSGSDDGTIIQWKLEKNKGYAIKKFEKQGMYVRGLCIFDNDILLSMNCDDKLRFWRISTQEILRDFQSYQDYGQSILFAK